MIRPFTWIARLSDSVRNHFQRGRMTPERAMALRGEDAAHRFLQKRHYRVVARNYRAASGGNEIDLIAWHADRLVFVEVKTRGANPDSAPERAVTSEKQRRIIHAAMDYTRRAKVDWGKVRFDVVAVTEGRGTTVELYCDAFAANPQL